MKKKLSMIIVVLALGAFAGIAVAQVTGIAGPPSGDGVQPVWYDDNPQAPAPDGGNSNCAYFNPSWFELRVPSATDGTYTKGGLSVDVTFYDGTLGIYTGQLMDWSSNTGVDAVFVKAGDEGNLYTYIPEDNGDTQLHGPVNPNNNQFIGVSHVSFCFDYEVTVTKTANTTFTRTFNWTIDKSVTPDTWDLFTGNSGTSEYTVAVTKDAGTDSDWAVSGTITIQNNTPLAATITDVLDAISGFGAAAVNCGVTFPHVLASGATLTCTYSTSLPDGSNRTNTATVTTSGTVGGGSASFPVTFGNPTTVVNDSITVTDTNSAFGGPYTVNGNMTWTYNRPFTCDADQGTHDNTATIVQTSQSDSASVTVNCYALQVRKNANTSFTRTYHWDITKEADASYNLFSGDTRDHKFTVSVDKTGFTGSNWAVSGVIGIRNPAPIAATINSVSDVISKAGDPDIAASVDCAVSFPYQMAANSSLTCTYSANLPDTATRTNTATATLQNYDYNSLGVGTASGTTDFTGPASVNFANATITEVNDSVSVTDTNVAFGGPKTASDDASWAYEVEFACDADDGSHTNTAKVIGDGDVELDSDTATVTIVCWGLTVTKDASTSFTRTWEWTIDKSADQTDLLLSEGQLFQVSYEVTVNATSTDSDHTVSGNISVNNPAPIDATLSGVSDVVSPNTAASVDCSVTFPYTLAAGATLNCTYSADLPDDSDRTNTATATLQNYDYDSDGIGTPSGSTGFSFSANVSFANATITEVDECVDVSDTNDGVLGTVCAGDAPKTFTYSLWFGAHPDADVVLECGDNTHTNTASFVTNDTSATGSDSWTVNANVACAEGCTLTPGYWKTHSKYGPAPFDDLWATNGQFNEDTPFFLSGKTYYEVLWTSPQGNAYYILAHAYIAAKLNILNGASSTPEVNAAITYAETFFSSHAPSDKLSKSERNAAIVNAFTLDSYNNGLSGPGHCSE